MIITLIVFSTSVVYAAPAMIVDVINHETKECGSYWAGDEWGGHDLPENWVVYSWESEEIIKTGNETCDLTQYDMNVCCDKFGYTQVGDVRGDYNPSHLWWEQLLSDPIIWLVLAALAIVLFVILFFIVKYLKRRFV